MKNCFIVAFLFCFIFSCGAQTLRVPSQYSYIQSAIDASHDGDVILLANGTYVDPVSGTASGPNTNIGTSGKAITIKSENGPQNCILNPTAKFGSGRLGFVINSGEGKNTVIDGITVYKGRSFIVSTANGYGGGMCIENASPTVRNCIITDCRADSANTNATGYGGGIYLKNSSSLIEGCVLKNNMTSKYGDSTGYGGAMYTENGAVTVKNSQFTNNNSSDGAIRAVGTNLMVSDSYFSSNSGGISIANGILDLVNCQIINNTNYGINSNSSTVNVSGNGAISSIYANGSSFVNISGGSIVGFFARNNSSTIFDGYDFILGNGLSWGVDGKTILGTGTLSGYWANGTSWSTNISAHDTTATIMAIPEPTTLVLFGLGGLVLRRNKKSLMR